MERISLDKQTKVMYSLYHFFVPMLYVGVLSSLGYSEGTGISGGFMLIIFLLFIIGLSISLFTVIRGICDYKKFLMVDGKYIFVCKQQGQKIKAIKQIEISKIKQINKGGSCSAFSVKTHEGKNVKLLRISPSILHITLTIPFISIPFIQKPALTKNIFEKKLSEKTGISVDNINDLPLNEIIRAEKTYNVIGWVFIAVVCYFGFLGLQIGADVFFAVISVLFGA